MRVLVCGGRDYDDAARVHDTLDKAMIVATGKITLIEGCARGADRLAETWALWRGYENLHFPADWNKHGKGAGPIRNRQMLVEGKPDLVIAFPGGRGTANMIAQSRAAGVTVVEVPG